MVPQSLSLKSMVYHWGNPSMKSLSLPTEPQQSRMGLQLNLTGHHLSLTGHHLRLIWIMGLLCPSLSTMTSLCMNLPQHPTGPQLSR